MRQIDNWDDIQEATSEFERPTPGGYISRIVSVEDVEDREYLRIEWDFEEGAYKGDNTATFRRAGFWPLPLIRSYKERALGFFKAFKTSVEASNPRYVFSTQNVHTLEGKLMGVVLGEEEYEKKDGKIGIRVYVYQVRSVEAIRKGDFKVPELKRLDPLRSRNSFGRPVYSEPNFTPLSDDGDIPF